MTSSTKVGIIILLLAVLGIIISMMKIENNGIGLIKEFEGKRLVAYQDSVGVWTIGYGHTKNVKEGDSIDSLEAEDLLTEELKEYAEYVNKYVKVPLNQNQFDALVSWTYNLGPSNLRESTMLKVLNNGEYDKVPAEMKRWNRAGGKVLAGLVRRREAEARLFLIPGEEIALNEI
jgi:lysozyme|tara:strand:- start:270 stop:794 length:525 start_codon:yes stop_codon:yes gene_type:complete